MPPSLVERRGKLSLDELAVIVGHMSRYKYHINLPSIRSENPTLIRPVPPLSSTYVQYEQHEGHFWDHDDSGDLVTFLSPAQIPDFRIN
jgi:hypothetical protein